MENNPLAAVYAFAEQAYIRMQAGDLLMRCLDTGSAQPMQELIESLVLAGPQSLAPLNEILQETESRRAQIQDDVQRLFGDYQNKMRQRGIKIGNLLPEAMAITEITPNKLLVWLLDQGITASKTHKTALRLLDQTQELMSSLAGHLSLLQDIENNVRDWLWAVAYQSAHEAQPGHRPPTSGLKI